VFGRAKRKREFHEALDKAWQALAKQRTEVERLLGPVAKKAMGSSTGSFESQLDAAHETKEEDEG